MDILNRKFSREEALKEILEIYSRWYILQAEPVKPGCGAEVSENSGSDITLVHSGRMDEEEGAYLMSRRATIWEAESHEYVYFFVVDHLTKAGLETAIEESYTRGMQCIKPGPKHRCSSIATIIVADAAAAEAVDCIKKFRKRENFKLSLHGWMDQWVGLAAPGKIECSPGSKRMEDILEYSLDPEGYRSRRRGIKGFLRKLFR